MCGFHSRNILPFGFTLPVCAKMHSKCFFSVAFTTPMHGKHSCNSHMCMCGNCVSLDSGSPVMWVTWHVTPANCHSWYEYKSEAQEDSEEEVCSLAKSDKSVRQMQQQERVGMEVGSIPIREERAKAVEGTWMMLQECLLYPIVYKVNVHFC